MDDPLVAESTCWKSFSLARQEELLALTNVVRQTVSADDLEFPVNGGVVDERWHDAKNDAILEEVDQSRGIFVGKKTS